MLETKNVESETVTARRGIELMQVLPLALLVLLGIASTWLYFWARDLHRFTQWLAAYIGLYIGELAIYALGCWIVCRRSANGNRQRILRTIAVVVFAVAFRFCLLAEMPFLSADVYRYVWDGRVQAAGINPYQYTPNDPNLARLRDKDIFESIPPTDRDWITPYPPVAQAVFWASYRLRPSSVGAFKFSMSLFDLIAVIALMVVLSRSGQDPARVIIFAWHPLLIFESAHSGHVEAVYIAFLALALLAWSYGKRWGYLGSVMTGGLVAGAGLVKFYPALLLPAFLRSKRLKRDDGLKPLETESVLSRARAALLSKTTIATVAGFLLMVLVCWLPYSGAGTRVLGFVGSYVADEGFAGTGSRYFLLELIRALIPFPTLLFLALAGALLLWLIVRASLRSGGDLTEVAETCAALVGIYLLITSPRYAWYYAWLLPFLAIRPVTGWLYLASASALLYLVWYTPLVYPNIPLWLGCGIYLPAIGLLALQRFGLLAFNRKHAGA